MTSFRLSRQKPHQARADVVVLFCPEGAAQPDGLPAGPLRTALRKVMRLETFKGKERQILVWHAPAGSLAARYVVVGTGEKKAMTLEIVRNLFAAVARRFEAGAGRVAATLPEMADRQATPSARVQAAVEGALLGAHRYDAYLAKNGRSGSPGKKGAGIRTLTLLGGTGARLEQAVRRGVIAARATLMARDMVCEPASVMTPRAMARRARAVARSSGLQITVADEKKLERLGMGCFLGVARGSDEPPRMVHLVYRPRRRTGKRRRIVLVGKGITFDSGGLSLKPPLSMETMKTDMAGAASVLATLSVLGELDCRHEVHGLLMMTENMPSGRAYKPGDILRSLSGKTVEVLNTDAEGRLVLADGLEYALTLKPDQIIDLATLTGACVVALGTLCTGVMGFDRDMVQAVLDAADAAGEKLWPLPFFSEYRRNLDSKVADIKHIGDRWGGAITAGMFLGEFVGTDVPWVHLDIAGPAYASVDQPLSRVGGTGHPVRTLLNYLEGLA
ncbi:MAG: leucyl aminopeptidase [Acidobacteriota bacterium]